VSNPLRDLLGITALERRIERTERKMAKAKDQLDALNAKVDDLVADVRAALDKLTADRDNLNPDAQEALDSLAAKIDAFDSEVGDADSSDTPPVDDRPIF
jgi:uncharacterized coiled-coil protein SlyX